MTREATTKCVSCGRFVPFSQMGGGGAEFYFEPDNHFGPERSEWTCARCVEKERREASDWLSGLAVLFALAVLIVVLP